MESNDKNERKSNDKNKLEILELQSEEISTEPENAKNQLNMYMYPDGLYHASKPSLIFMSWFYFKQMFQMISNGFKNKKVKKLIYYKKFGLLDVLYSHVQVVCHY